MKLKKNLRKTMLIILSALFAAAALSGCGDGGIQEKHEAQEPVSMVVVTDTHFAGSEYYAYTGTYEELSDFSGTGKQMRYEEELLDAFISELLEKNPEYVLITGDLSYVGAKESHEAFARKLQPLRDAGMNVLVIPGNHDIDSIPMIYPDGEMILGTYTTPEDFAEIYADFGYGNADSYHDKTLSYMVNTGKGIRIFMMDTNFVYGVAYGQIKPDALAWLEEELAACQEAGDVPVVAGHHNLLLHHPLFDFGYRVNNWKAVTELFEKYDVNLYLSGHLHIQDIENDGNVYDIVGQSFAVYPHRYAELSVSADGWSYESRKTDVAGYARAAGLTDENLLNFDDYGYHFFYDNAYRQALERMADVADDEEELAELAAFSAELQINYFGGTLPDVSMEKAEEMRSFGGSTRWTSYMNSVLDKSDKNNLSLVFSKP